MGVRAVLWDMDGTLVDSEKKLWDVAINELYTRHGRVLSPEVRDATVGGSADGGVIRIVFADLGLDPHPGGHMAEVADWMHEYVGELFFSTGLPWCPGARELLDALRAADVPMALVTNTRRGLTENALNSIGRHYFFSATVCGDEVPEGKPAPRTFTCARPSSSGLPQVSVWRSRTRSPAPLRRRRRLPGACGAQRDLRAGRPPWPTARFVARRVGHPAAAADLHGPAARARRALSVNG